MVEINSLKEYRERADLSQDKLASLVGVTQRYIGFIEAGDRNPSLKVAKKIADALNSTVDEIFLTKKCTDCTQEKGETNISAN